MQNLFTLNTLYFLLIALAAMFGHGLKKYLMREIQGSLIDWYRVHPRATGLALFTCVSGILGAVFGGALLDVMDGAQVIAAAGIGYGADTLNSQNKGAKGANTDAAALLVLLFLAFLPLTIPAVAYAQDARYCGVINRVFPSGETKRSAAIKNQFKADWPCNTPCDSTWQIDHVIPLIEGGCDAEINMAWMPPSIKTCAAPAKPGDPFCKDRWEQEVYRHDALPVQWWYRGKKVPAP